VEIREGKKYCPMKHARIPATNASATWNLELEVSVGIGLCEGAETGSGRRDSFSSPYVSPFESYVLSMYATFVASESSMNGEAKITSSGRAIPANAVLIPSCKNRPI
jgi:hypothetical protein